MSFESRTGASSGNGEALQPMIVTLETAEAIRPFGIEMKVMLGREHTGGTFSAIYGELKPGEGPDLHLHHDREEYFYVLDGTYAVGIDGKETIVGPGSMVFVPRGTVHSIKNIGTTAGRALEWTVPGGNGDYFREMHRMGAGGGFNPAVFAEINQRYRTEFAR